ncbi:Type II and III secretion system family protein [Aeromonas salmonicida]|nr:Type II and III secretion system family protein [Aeromonas salmonicida]
MMVIARLAEAVSRASGQEREMKRWRWSGILLLWGLWCLPLRAEVKVIPVFEAEAMVQTLKEIYPDLGVSAMGNQLVLSGSAAQLQEADATLAKLNQPPQSLLVEWRVDGASSGQQIEAGIGGDAAKRQWLLEGNARQYQRSQNDSWQVRGLSGRPVLLQMGSYQPVTFYQWRGGQVVGLIPLINGLYATATLIGDRVQIALSSEQARLEQGTVTTGQNATEVSGAPGQWLTVGELSTNSAGQGSSLGTQSQGDRSSQSDRQTLQIRVTRQ